MKLTVSHRNIFLLDFFLWPFIQAFRQKKSCWWHWRSMPWFRESLTSAHVPLLDCSRGADFPDDPPKPEAICVVKPYTDKIAYQIGIKTTGGIAKVCVVIIPPGKMAALPVRSERTYLFAFTEWEEGKWHPSALGLQLVEFTTRDKLPENAILL
jgi:hypothetical protein